MLTKSNWLLLLLLFVILSSAQAQKVAVWIDHAVDFSKYKTYSWTTGVPAKNPAIEKKIIALFDEHMSAKGLTRKDDNADMMISYHSTVLNPFDSETGA